MNEALKYYKVENEGITTFYDSETKSKTMEWIYDDDNVISQIRIYLDDKDKAIKDKKLIFDKNINQVYLSYEKLFNRNGKEVIESYSDDEMWMYSETEHIGNVKTTMGYGDNREMFWREIIEYDENGKAITEEQLIYDAEGTKTEYKIDLLTGKDIY